jgi:hypothetical protein
VHITLACEVCAPLFGDAITHTFIDVERFARPSRRRAQDPDERAIVWLVRPNELHNQSAILDVLNGNVLRLDPELISNITLDGDLTTLAN